MAERLAEIRERENEIRLGGGLKAIERQHEKGRLTARERIAALCDPGAPFFELSLWAADGMYAEVGGAPSAGAITGIGKIHGRNVMVVANDATVKAGAFFPATCKKVIRAQRIVMQTHLPAVYLVDSAGVFLPMQDEVFPDEDDFGRIFRHNAVISAMGIPQVAAIMGNCVAGGGYLPVMCDTLLMTEGSGLYLAGPALVRSAIGQKVDHEELGGAFMHAAISGTVDFREKDDPSCIQRLRRLIDGLGPPSPSPFKRSTPRPAEHDPRTILEHYTDQQAGEYDMRELLAHVVDAESWDEFKAEYGQSLITAFARIDGWSVGIVANQKKRTTPAKGPIEMGGVIYHESADKAARFIMNCNQQHIPLIFVHDVNGFMVGRDSEQAGIIRSGAKMVNVVSNSVVPKISLLVGGSYGAGHYALCGRAYDPTFILAWPTARYAVMGGMQAAMTLLQIQEQALEKKGHKIDRKEHEELLAAIKQSYDEKTDVRYAASRGWIDAIIDPHETRTVLSQLLEFTAHPGELPPFRTGALQV
ncbi:MAG TPA: acyl-CoA carboxylase subunit beta [Phycisphaerae bacterium]|jgi:acetyl-CoA carboxylase carboxyltransferase component